MSASVENMFYVSNESNGRFKPWHGLGVAVENAPNSAEALKLAGLDWNVLQHEVRDAETHLILNGYKANVRDIDNKPLGIVSNRYKIVQNTEAFDFTDNLINSGDVRYETAGSLFDGKKVWLLARMPAISLLGDDVDPYIVFSNTHDGSGAVRICMTPTRVVCNNTLNIALSNAKRSWSTRHTGDMASKLAEAKSTLQLAENYMNGLKKEAESLYSVKVDEKALAEFIKLAFPDPKVNSRTAIENHMDDINSFNVAMMQSDLANFKGTGWQLVNAMADFTSHKTPNRATASYNERKFDSVMNGAKLLDLAYDYARNL